MAEENKNPAAPVPVEPQAAAPETQTSGTSASPVEPDEKFFAALGYFAFLFVIPLIVKPKSSFCKFHAKQSMVLFLITILVLVVLASIPWIGSLLTLALFAVYVLAIYRAYLGELWNIPVVSQLSGKMDVDKLYSKAGLAVSSLGGLKDKAGELAKKAADTAKNLGKQEETKTPPTPPASAPPAAPKT